MDSQLAPLTGARQTMLAWSQVIESFEDIPAPFKNAFEPIWDEKRPFPYTVFAPSIAGLRHKTTEKLLCDHNGSITVWEHNGDHLTVNTYPIEQITDIEVGYILLFSWITISGVTKTGEPASSTIEFNTATTRYFIPFVNKLRPAPIDAIPHVQSTERAKFDYLERQDFKFMNFAIDSLAGDEKVLHTLWQPKMTRPILKLGQRALERTIALAHLAILTDKELIMIQDDERSRENRGVRYGGKWQYIALRHIKTVSLQEQSDKALLLSLTLTPGERPLSFLFAAQQQQSLIQLQDKLEALLG
ncbi:MAG: hypothetical protein KC415_13885 [Anaerolineales bacterium]|nr:hypothetical protein [Anaerolineales bacterium]MCB9004623.1 hypothetical protein [Ardenticatenaceae bacterium]